MKISHHFIVIKRIFITLVILTFSVSNYCKEIASPTTILYHNTLNVKGEYPEIMINNDHARYTNEGLMITEKNDLVRLDKYYSLGERSVRYHVKFSENAKAVFQSNTGDFKVYIDLLNKSLYTETNPTISKKIDFINSNDEYLVEIYHAYQTAKVKIINIYTGQSDYLEMTNDGPGGHGAGVINTAFRVGMQHDYYCFGLSEGDFLLVKQITILSRKSDLTLLIYGDSITEPEDYFPTNEFLESWTQLIMENINGPSMSSGRGGCTIHEILLRIKNELPYVKAKYVMITVGTNGGNTVENLSELVEYILSQNSIPILNNIPCNESQTQIEVNKQIEIVRKKYGINGCRFDWATSKDYKGVEVDRTTMFHEDYRDSWGQIYHHPNVEGSKRMFIRTLVDSPEIYQ